MKIITLGMLLFFHAFTYSGMYSKHWFGKQSNIQSSNINPLLIHDLFIISFDTNKKFPQWVAYQLSPGMIFGNIKAQRDYIKDPYLKKKDSLSVEQYKGASKFGYQKGHLAPVGSFKNSSFIYQAQYLSNIAPQHKNLNQGPWRTLEDVVRNFVKKGQEVRVYVGPIYGNKNNPDKKFQERNTAIWPAANGFINEIPVGFWKVVSMKNKGTINTCSFLMPQKIEGISQGQNPWASVKKYIIKQSELKKYTKLVLFEGVTYKENCDFLKAK